MLVLHSRHTQSRLRKQTFNVVCINNSCLFWDPRKNTKQICEINVEFPNVKQGVLSRAKRRYIKSKYQCYNSDCNHRTRLAFHGNNLTLLVQIVSDLNSTRLWLFRDTEISLRRLYGGRQRLTASGCTSDTWNINCSSKKSGIDWYNFPIKMFDFKMKAGKTFCYIVPHVTPVDVIVSHNSDRRNCNIFGTLVTELILPKFS